MQAAGIIAPNNKQNINNNPLQVNNFFNNNMNNNANHNMNNNANHNMNNNANHNMNNNINPNMNNMNNNINPNMNNMNNNIGFMPQMSPEQFQMMQRQQFELQKQQARQIGQLLKKQKEFIEEMKRKDEQRKKEEDEKEIILFFNHDYDILPLTFKKSTTVLEALSDYINKTNKQNVIFKHEGKELKMDYSGTSLKDVEGLLNGSEITVINK